MQPQGIYAPTQGAPFSINTDDTTPFIDGDNPNRQSTYASTRNTHEARASWNGDQANVNDEHPTPCCLSNFDNFCLPGECSTNTKKLMRGLCDCLCCCGHYPALGQNSYLACAFLTAWCCADCDNLC